MLSYFAGYKVFCFNEFEWVGVFMCSFLLCSVLFRILLLELKSLKFSKPTLIRQRTVHGQNLMYIYVSAVMTQLKTLAKYQKYTAYNFPLTLKSNPIIRAFWSHKATCP